MVLKKRAASQPARIIILSGPSGAGKTTLHDLLLTSPRFQGKIVRSISATTRAPRGQEKHGREYLFLTKKMFEYMIRTNQFLEWARVFDHYYGTPLKNVEAHLKKGRSVLLCIDVQGGELVKKRMKNAIAIFVKTPTLKELERRLMARGTDTEEAVALRLKTARKELTEAKKYDYVIVNNNLEKAHFELQRLLDQKLGF